MNEYQDEVYSHGLRMGFELKKKLFSGTSAFQKVEVVETAHHGRMLFNDGCAMLSERDEAIYHEMMAHVPLFTHPDPKRVLVIGGGDGGTAREVLRHQEVAECYLVEIDPMVIEACRQYIPQTAAIFSDPRFKLHIGDGVQFVAVSDLKFDVIMVDSTDPIGPAAPLFGAEFYRNVKARLDKNGIVVAQGETPFYELQAQKSLMSVMGPYFSLVRPYNFTNMTYPGGLWSFVFASNGVHPLRDFNLTRWQSWRSGFKYYNDEIHQAAFALPTFMREELGSVIRE